MPFSIDSRLTFVDQPFGNHIFSQETHKQEITHLKQNHETEKQQLVKEIKEIKEKTAKLQTPPPETKFVQMMEQQVIKLSEIIQKKEKEISHLEMIIQRECAEREQLQLELSQLKSDAEKG